MIFIRKGEQSENCTCQIDLADPFSRAPLRNDRNEENCQADRTDRREYKVCCGECLYLGTAHESQVVCDDDLLYLLQQTKQF